MVLYKGVLKDWFKGTGGGSGLCTEFEGWNDEKLERFDVDLDTYDHTDIASRPAVLINGYCKQRIPYLTTIHLWDKVSDYFLSSRHDRVKIGRGEGGFDGTPDDFSSMSDSSPNAKRRARKSGKLKNGEPATNGIAAVFKSVFESLDSKKDGNSNDIVGRNVIAIKNLSLPELYVMIEQHKLHLDFLKENDMLVDGEKEDIVDKISYIFDVIEGRRGGKRTRSPDGVSN